MANSQVFTLLPLEQFFAIMGIGHFEANQIGAGITYHREAQCDTVFYQYPWQLQFVSRDEVARAISKAEHMLAPILNFWPAPKYIVDENVQYPRSTWPTTPNLMTARGQWKPVKLRYGYIQALGTFQRTLIEADISYTMSDDDGDGVDDTFALTVATTETDPAKLALYFNAADRNTPISLDWQIRPVECTISGGNAVFVGKLSQITVPLLWRSPDPQKLDATDVAIYVESLDVYLHETNGDNTGTAYWDGYVGQAGTSSGTISGNSVINNSELGYFRPDFSLCGLWNESPNRLMVNYLAGYPRESDGSMSEPFASIVAHLAMAYMPAKKCGCERSNQIWNYWRSFPNDSEDGSRPMIPQEIANNPFPPTRGGLYAWSGVLDWQLTGGAMA
jgi:hypothetical protein